MKILSVVMIFWSSIALGQAIEGTVRDINDHSALEGASIIISSVGGVSSDQKGRFLLENLVPGRYQIEVGYVGYSAKIIRDVIVKSAQITTLEVFLSPRPLELEVVQVSDRTPFQGPGRRTINADQINRFASTYYDPTRLLMTSPDIAVVNDQNNQISVRGISPAYNTWRLEGAEIVNPNHLSNAGTLSDQPTQAGGGVNAISAQVLGVSSFDYGVMPSRNSNTVGGLFDLRIKDVNKSEFQASVQASLIGLDFMAEGPLGKKGKTGFIANYRYSFTGLLSQFGVDFGGESIGFQDLNFSTHTTFENGSSLRLFTVLAGNFNRFNHLSFNESLREKDRSDIDFEGQTGIFGFNYNLSGWDVTYAYSESDEFREQQDYDEVDQPADFYNTQNGYSIHSLSFSKTFSLNRSQVILDGGFNRYEWTNDQIQLSNTLDQSWRAQLYHLGGQWNVYLTSSWLLEMGNKLYYNNDRLIIDPRVKLNFLMPNWTYYLSAGYYSQMLNPYNFRFDVFDRATVRGTPIDGFMRSNRFIAGAQFSKNGWEGSMEAFGYVFGDVQVPENENSSALTRGLSLSLEKNATAGWYVLGGLSVFKSTYDANQINNTYNSTLRATTSAGKLWQLGDDKSRTLEVNGRGTFQGGLWNYFPFASVMLMNDFMGNDFTVNPFFKSQADPFIRFDMRVQYTKHRERTTRTWSIDIQNLTNRINVTSPYFDSFANEVQYLKQLGLIPILTYRIDF